MFWINNDFNETDEIEEIFLATTNANVTFQNGKLSKIKTEQN